MGKRIESIWKESFSEGEIKDIHQRGNPYNQKSRHLVDKLRRMFRYNLIAVVAMALVFWTVHFFIDAIWQGTSATVLLLGLAWYSERQMRKVYTLDPSLSSYEYLKSFDHYLKAALSKNLLVIRFFYSLIFLTAMSTIWFAGDNQIILKHRVMEKFPDSVFIGNVPLTGIVIVGLMTLLIAYLSDKIYKWDVELIYGQIFKKLRKIIAEMEELKDNYDTRQK